MGWSAGWTAVNGSPAPTSAPAPVRALPAMAVEAMGSVEERQRMLSVVTEQGAADVLIAVHDSGPGIDPEHLQRVFEPFYTTKNSGLGMGLSICRSIIAAHGGALWAEVNRPRGAIFHFTLPAGLENS